MAVISETTVSLIDGLTRPLATSGALHPSERSALLAVLKAATVANDKPEVRRNLLTLAATADRLCVCKKTVRRLVDSGHLDAVYLRKGSPRTIRIKEDSIVKMEAGE